MATTDDSFTHCAYQVTREVDTSALFTGDRLCQLLWQSPCRILPPEPCPKGEAKVNAAGKHICFACCNAAPTVTERTARLRENVLALHAMIISVPTGDCTKTGPPTTALVLQWIMDMNSALAAANAASSAQATTTHEHYHGQQRPGASTGASTGASGRPQAAELAQCLIAAGALTLCTTFIGKEVLGVRHELLGEICAANKVPRWPQGLTIVPLDAVTAAQERAAAAEKHGLRETLKLMRSAYHLALESWMSLALLYGAVDADTPLLWAHHTANDMLDMLSLVVHRGTWLEARLAVRVAHILVVKHCSLFMTPGPWHRLCLSLMDALVQRCFRPTLSIRPLIQEVSGPLGDISWLWMAGEQLRKDMSSPDALKFGIPGCIFETRRDFRASCTAYLYLAGWSAALRTEAMTLLSWMVPAALIAYRATPLEEQHHQRLQYPTAAQSMETLAVTLVEKVWATEMDRLIASTDVFEENDDSPFYMQASHCKPGACMCHAASKHTYSQVPFVEAGFGWAAMVMLLSLVAPPPTYDWDLANQPHQGVGAPDPWQADAITMATLRALTDQPRMRTRLFRAVKVLLTLSEDDLVSNTVTMMAMSDLVRRPFDPTTPTNKGTPQEIVKRRLELIGSKVLKAQAAVLCTLLCHCASVALEVLAAACMHPVSARALVFHHAAAAGSTGPGGTASIAGECFVHLLRKPFEHDWKEISSSEVAENMWEYHPGMFTTVLRRTATGEVLFYHVLGHARLVTALALSHLHRGFRTLVKTPARADREFLTRLFTAHSQSIQLQQLVHASTAPEDLFGVESQLGRVFAWSLVGLVIRSTILSRATPAGAKALRVLLQLQTRLRQALAAAPSASAISSSISPGSRTRMGYLCICRWRGTPPLHLSAWLESPSLPAAARLLTVDFAADEVFQQQQCAAFERLLSSLEPLYAATAHL